MQPTDITKAATMILCSPLGAALYAADPGSAVARCRGLAADLMALDVPVEPREALLLAALVDGWDRLCLAAARPSLSVREALEMLYPPPDSPEDDGWAGLRDVLRELTGEPTPGAWRLGMVLRGLNGKTVGGRRLVAAGVAAGRMRWCVLTD